jgi:hypothetical protein
MTKKINKGIFVSELGDWILCFFLFKNNRNIFYK